MGRRGWWRGTLGLHAVARHDGSGPEMRIGARGHAEGRVTAACKSRLE